MKKISTFADNWSCASANCLNYIKMTILAIPLFVLLTQQSHAAAASSGITYTGRILDSTDQPVTASQVYFTITISDPDQKCWLYTEQRLVDMSASAGNFAFEVGSNDPTTLYGTPSLNNPLGGGPATFADIFDNSKSFSSLAAGSYTSCTGSYDPSTATDKYSGRVMAIFFRIGAAGTDQALPALRITPVPMAMQAINSVKVNGYDKNHLLRIDQSIGSPVNSDINATQLAEFFRLVNAPGTAYLSSVPSLSGDVTGAAGSTTVGKIQNVAVTAPTTGDTGKVLTYNGTNLVWQTAASSAITSLNGLTTATQSFATGTSGTDFGISSSGSAHTFNLPNASATNRGALSSADWSTFNSKQSSSLGAAQVWIGNASGGAQAQTLSGDATVSAAGVVTVDKTQSGAASKILQLDGSGVANSLGIGLINTGTVRILPGTPATASYDLKLPVVAPANNQILKSNASGDLSWVTYLAQVSDSAPLTNGKMWIGNASGVAAEVAMSGDATIDNAGLLTLKNTGSVGTYSKVVTDAQGRVTSGSALASGDVTTALGYTPVSTNSGYVNGGNTFAGNASIGLNDAFNLNIKTNGTPRMTIMASGNVGIGTATPSASLHVSTNSTADSVTGQKIDLTWNPSSNNVLKEGYGRFVSANFLGKTGGMPAVGDVILVNYSPTQSGNSWGQYISLKGAGSSGGILNGVNSDVVYSMSGVGAAESFRGSVILDSSSVLSWAHGGTFNVETKTSPSAYIATAIGVTGSVKGGAGQIVEARGVSSEVVKNGVGVIDNAYGVYVGAVAGTNKWSIYTTDNGAPSYFAGNVGIGEPSPSAKLEVVGHIAASGGPATLGTCGASPTITGNDTKGFVTIGSGVTTSCAITFNSAFTSAPVCTITWRGAASTIAVGVTASTTVLTVNFSADSQSLSFNYHCLQ